MTAGDQAREGGADLDIDLREPLSERAQRDQLRRESATLRDQIDAQTAELKALRESGTSGPRLRHLREDLAVSRARLEMVRAGLEELRLLAESDAR